MGWQLGTRLLTTSAQCARVSLIGTVLAQGTASESLEAAGRVRNSVPTFPSAPGWKQCSPPFLAVLKEIPSWIEANGLPSALLVCGRSPGSYDLPFCSQGIKRILPHQMTTAGPVLGEERRSDEFFDSLDHVIDIHGHIIGMGLSPDHR